MFTREISKLHNFALNCADCYRRPGHTKKCLDRGLVSISQKVLALDLGDRKCTVPYYDPCFFFFSGVHCLTILRMAGYPSVASASLGTYFSANKDSDDAIEAYGHSYQFPSLLLSFFLPSLLFSFSFCLPTGTVYYIF